MARRASDLRANVRACSQAVWGWRHASQVGLLCFLFVLFNLDFVSFFLLFLPPMYTNFLQDREWDDSAWVQF